MYNKELIPYLRNAQESKDSNLLYESVPGSVMVDYYLSKLYESMLKSISILYNEKCAVKYKAEDKEKAVGYLNKTKNDIKHTINTLKPYITLKKEDCNAEKIYESFYGEDNTKTKICKHFVNIPGDFTREWLDKNRELFKNPDFKPAFRSILETYHAF